MKLAVLYRICEKWKMSEIYGLNLADLTWLVRHCLNKNRQVMAACVFVGGKMFEFYSE